MSWIGLSVGQRQISHFRLKLDANERTFGRAMSARVQAGGVSADRGARAESGRSLSRLDAERDFVEALSLAAAF